MIEPGNVVKDFYIGETRVRICDDYCRDKTPDDVEEILRRIAKNALAAINAAENQKADEQKRKAG